MCELLALSNRRPTHITFSLKKLAAHGALASKYHDGWGVAFYDDKDVALFREPTAAGDSALVRFIEEQGPSTSLAISHIRRATRGAVNLSNTQPFSRELAGRTHVFAHNGDLPDIEQSMKIGVDRYRPVGTTDSEYAFCSLLDRMQALWHSSSGLPPIDKRLSVVSEFAADLRKLGPANFLYADGDALFAHGHRRIQAATGKVTSPGLWLLPCRCADTDEPVQVVGVSIAPGFQEGLLIASVPLTDDQWQPFSEGEIVAVSAGKIVGSLRP